MSFFVLYADKDFLWFILIESVAGQKYHQYDCSAALAMQVQVAWGFT